MFIVNTNLAASLEPSAVLASASFYPPKKEEAVAAIHGCCRCCSRPSHPSQTAVVDSLVGVFMTATIGPIFLCRFSFNENELLLQKEELLLLLIALASSAGTMRTMTL